MGLFDDVTGQMLDLTDFVQRTVIAAAKAQPSNQVALVESASGGLFRLKLPSGAILQGVENKTRQRFQPGDWVSIEAGYPGLWQVVGPGGQAAE